MKTILSLDWFSKSLDTNLSVFFCELMKFKIRKKTLKHPFEIF